MEKRCSKCNGEMVEKLQAHFIAMGFFGFMFGILGGYFFFKGKGNFLIVISGMILVGAVTLFTSIALGRVLPVRKTVLYCEQCDLEKSGLWSDLKYQIKLLPFYAGTAAGIFCYKFIYDYFNLGW